MTTDDLQKGLPAARRPASAGVSPIHFFGAALLCLASFTAQAQTVPTPSQGEPANRAPTSVSSDTVVTDAKSSIRDKATEAAAVTLTALLPRLAAGDTMPMLDRSAMFATDLSQLVSNYDLTRSGVIAPQESRGKVQSVLKRALTLLGTPYRWGGTSPDSGFDCSGLVGYVFRTALGIELPRVSREMASEDSAELIKDRDSLRQGDLVFFGLKGRVNHVGIYVGEGRFLHSPSTGKDVRVDTLLSGYWSAKFMQARRVAM
ncbi:peptidoglycan endopeptidase [Pseudoxanthomonas gei]|uniref:Peptidoglycan endopeptidase n=1 Tax=Pseudoxanthomonas gei TaxID=1383030 RepID=A0ABX0AEA9_9GAMM|nr:peptidoglycan endopeptidase [Pseudoxanthomonas gei]